MFCTKNTPTSFTSPKLPFLDHFSPQSINTLYTQISYITVCSMGQQPSKDELLYQQVDYGNIEGIKALHNDGAGLEWLDKEGKTPLIVACLNPELCNVTKTLIGLGANVNAYRPGLQSLFLTQLLQTHLLQDLFER